MPSAHWQRFSFLYRTDKGRIDRATWWRNVAPLIAVALAGAVGWELLSPYARHDLATQAFIVPLTIAAYAYLLVFTLVLMLVGACAYNLNAKRFRDRGLPPALAAILPLSLLFGGALIWFIPQSFDTVPGWAAPVAVVAMATVAAWTVVELGIRSGSARR